MKHFQVTVNGTVYDVQVQEVEESDLPVSAEPAPAEDVSAVSGEIISPVSGSIGEVMCEVGQAVARGDTLLIVHEMESMEDGSSATNSFSLTADEDGTVAGIYVAKGDAIEAGVLLVSLG